VRGDSVSGESGWVRGREEGGPKTSDDSFLPFFFWRIGSFWRRGDLKSEPDVSSGVVVGRGAGEARAEEAADEGLESGAASSGAVEDAGAVVTAAGGKDDAGSAARGEGVCFSSEGVDESSDF